MNQLDAFTSEEMDRFYATLGRMAYNAGRTAKFARHSKPSNSVRDYLDIQPEDDKITRAAKEYLKNVLFSEGVSKKAPRGMGLKASTTKNYRAALADFARYLGQDPEGSYPELASRLYKHLSKLDDASKIAAGYRAELEKKGLATASINVVLAAIKSLNDSARIQGSGWRIDVQSLLIQRKKEVVGPAVKLVTKVIAELEKGHDPRTSRDLALIRLLYDRGIRRGEVATLDVSDFDPPARRLQILGKGRWIKEWVDLDEKTVAAIQHWLTFRGTEPGSLFKNFDPTGKGNRLTGTSIWRIVVGYGLGTPHQLRHSRLTKMIMGDCV